MRNSREVSGNRVGKGRLGGGEVRELVEGWKCQGLIGTGRS